MFLVLSMTVFGSILALAALLLRRALGRRLGGAERWLWLPVLLRLCVPLSGPVRPVGDAFQRLQLMAWDGYTQLESNWLLGPGRSALLDKLREITAALLDKLREITAALPENANAFPLGTVKSPVPVSLPIPLSIRLCNPNTWLVIWLIGAIICFCLTLWPGREKPLRFRWFSAAALSLHWFNPLMIPVRRALAHPVPGAEEGKAKAKPLAVLCAAGLLALGIALGVLPGGPGTDLFHGADRYALDELTGGEHWNRFLRRVEAGHPAAIRIVRYFNPE